MIPSPSDGAPRVSSALASLAASGPLPRLSWTGVVDGTPERLELSGRVSATWANKVANLLVEEIDAGPGTRVVLDLPLHWRTLAWATGAWLTGATVVAAEIVDAPDVEHPPGGSELPDVLVTASASAAKDAVRDGVELVVLVPMASFALRVVGGLPAGALDGAADVAAQPDDLGPVRTTEAARTALELDGRTWTFADLFGREEPGGTGETWWGAVAVREWSSDADVVLEGAG